MTEGNQEKNPNQLGQHQDLNSELSEYESSVMNFYQHYALCTSQSAGAEIRASIFNRCNDAVVRTREILLVHAPCDIITLPLTRSRFTQ